MTARSIPTTSNITRRCWCPRSASLARWRRRRAAGGGGRGGGGHRGGGGGRGGWWRWRRASRRWRRCRRRTKRRARAAANTRATYGKQGAARFSYFDFPEPVTVADTNFNRGVDPTEFQHAADVRFAMLDKNGDGKIERNELPRISSGPRRWPGRPGPGPGAVPVAGDDAPADRPRDTP